MSLWTTKPCRTVPTTKPPVVPYVREERTLGRVAPALQRVLPLVEEALQAAKIPFRRFETFRPNERQWYIFGQGRTADALRDAGVPERYARPGRIVTKARDASYSLHGYGLAVDYIHPTLKWDAPAAYWEALQGVVTKYGFVWGGHWASLPDVPHFQWAEAPLGPRRIDREAHARGDLVEVWTRTGAM